MSCVYFAAILEAKKILPTLYYGPQAGPGQKICCSLAERAGLGSFMLAPGGPGCKSAGPCHLYATALIITNFHTEPIPQIKVNHQINSLAFTLYTTFD